jgi:hypothetical protein
LFSKVPILHAQAISRRRPAVIAVFDNDHKEKNWTERQLLPSLSIIEADGAIRGIKGDKPLRKY